MQKAARFILLACLVIVTARTQAAELRADHPLLLAEQRLFELYQKFNDTVVRVKVAVRTKDETGADQVALTVLSGFYIDAQGTVLTNAIPMQEGTRLWIEQNGISLLAVPVASDTRSNLGLVRVAKPPENIHFIDLEQAAPDLPIGSLAYAITSPLDFSPTPKLGLVSGRESRFSDIVFPFTQTRISISSGPAEGGAPVFNSAGAFIGISVAALPEIDSSYIVSPTFLQKIVPQLREQKKTTYPSIQANFEERGNPAQMKTEIIVTEVEKNGAAERGGLKPGDHILQFQSRAVQSVDDLRNSIFFSVPKNFATLLIRRDDTEKEITLLLGEE